MGVEPPDHLAPEGRARWRHRRLRDVYGMFLPRWDRLPPTLREELVGAEGDSPIRIGAYQCPVCQALGEWNGTSCPSCKNGP